MFLHLIRKKTKNVNKIIKKMNNIPKKARKIHTNFYLATNAFCLLL